MPDEKPQDASAQAPAKAEGAPASPKTYAPEEVEKILASAKAARDEAKSYREKVEAIEKAKAEAEKAKMQAEGDLKGLLEKATAEKEALAKKAALADEYEGAFKARLEAALPKIPEDIRAEIASLPPRQALTLAEKYAALTTGPAKAPPTTAGNPAAPVPYIDIDKLSPEERSRVLDGMKPEQMRELLAQRGGLAQKRVPFARTFGK